jgi:DNA-binding PadR family transcriptional regulator
MSTTTGASPEFPPLTPAVFAILLALADGEKHGYAIMQEARQHSAMGPGTLYGSLDRLLASGFIAETGFTDDERRRYYRLTGPGRQALAAEAARMQQAVARVRRKGIKPQEARA